MIGIQTELSSVAQGAIKTSPSISMAKAKGNAYRRTGVATHDRPEHVYDQVAESVHNEVLLGIARCRGHHPKNAHPARYTR